MVILSNLRGCCVKTDDGDVDSGVNDNDGDVKGDVDGGHNANDNEDDSGYIHNIINLYSIMKFQLKNNGIIVLIDNFFSFYGSLFSIYL